MDEDGPQASKETLPIPQGGAEGGAGSMHENYIKLKSEAQSKLNSAWPDGVNLSELTEKQLEGAKEALSDLMRLSRVGPEHDDIATRLGLVTRRLDTK